MEHIIKSILCELEYIPEKGFNINYNDKSFSISPFVSETAESQVFLVIPITELGLIELSPDFSATLAQYFRKTNFYSSDMDKNTSIIYCVKLIKESELFKNTKVKVEDDPYYFKKYVFSYSEKEEESVTQTKNEHPNSTYVQVIQKIISDTTQFEKYKQNPQNAPLYSCVANLVTKIPQISIEIKPSTELSSVESYVNANLEKKSVIDCVPVLDQIIEFLYENGNGEPTVLMDKAIELWDSMEDENDK